jgi:Fur family ferric uptake transcriptional regulator
MVLGDDDECISTQYLTVERGNVILDAKHCNNKGLQMSCGDQLASDLRRQGYRVTPQRAVILETIAHLEGHSSVNEVFEMAKERLPGLNIATVYRTLEKLHDAGLMDLLSTSGDSMRFSLRDRSNRHGHLHCRICGLEFEIPAQHFRKMFDEIKDQYGFKVDGDHLSLGGICGECRHDTLTRNPKS